MREGRLTENSGPSTTTTRAVTRVALNAAAEADRVQLAADVRASTLDESNRSVESVIVSARVNNHWMMEHGRVDLAFDFRGVTLPESVPLIDSHSQYSIEHIRGSVRELRVEGTQLAGRLFFADDPASEAAYQKVRGKHLQTVSIGAAATRVEVVRPGESAAIDGERFTAGAARPLVVFTEWAPEEVSLVTIPADKQARIRAGAGARQGVTMNEQLLAFLRSKGLGESATLEQAQAFLDGLKGPDYDEAVRLQRAGNAPAASDGNGGTPNPAGGASVTASNTPNGTPVPNPPSNDGNVVNLEAERGRILAEAREQARAELEAERAAERTRVEAIRALAESDDERVIAQRAIDDGWDVPRAQQAMLAALRQARSEAAPSGVGILMRSTDGAGEVGVMSAALALSTGDSDIDARLTGDARDRETRFYELAQQHYGNGMTYVDIMRASLAASGQHVPMDRHEIIRLASSGGSFNDVLSNVVEKKLMRAFMEADNSASGMAFETDVPNYKLNDVIGVEPVENLSPVPTGDTAKHATIEDAKEQYRVTRFGEQLVFDEIIYINDDMGVLQRTPVYMGQAAARVFPDMFYSLLLANATMRDGTALFHADHSNLGTTGTALSVASLSAGIASMMKQTKGKRGGDVIHLNVKPRYLVVPPDLWETAMRLLTSAELRGGSGEAGTRNVIAGMGIEPRVDNRIGTAGVKDPITGDSRVGTATNWFLMGDPNTSPTIEAGFLSGTGRRPTLRRYTLDRGQWGVGFDIQHVLGMKSLDWRGVRKHTGAA